MGIRKRTSEEFKTQMFKKYDGKVEILGEYKGVNDKIKFVYHCEKHGDVYSEINAKNISSNKTFQPCTECMRENKRTNYRKPDELLEELRYKAESFGGELLDSEWVKSKHKYRFKCANKNHPIFKATHDAVMGSKRTWCPYCSGRFGNFNEEIKNIVENNNGELLTDYESAYKHVKVKCNIDGYEWNITPTNLRKGRWCYVCKMPRSERIVYDLLVESKLKIVPQFSFKDLIGLNKQEMRFDFAVFKNDILLFLLEIDDNEHRYAYSDKSVRGRQRIRAQKRDEEKNTYCKENKIKLLRIDIDIYSDIFKDDKLYYYFIKQNIVEKMEDIWL